MTIWSNNYGCFVIAEVGLNHNGDFEMASELIRQIAATGADAVKFQKRDVPSLATREVLDAYDDRFPSLGTTYGEIRAKLEFDLEQFSILRDLATSLGLAFFATPFDIPSLDFLEKLKLDRYKIASHGVTNLPLLEKVAETGKPVLISTGMATVDEIDEAISLLSSRDSDLGILHCISSYPTSSSEARLELIDFLSNRYGLPTGYSGHENGMLTTLVAIGRGATIVERHVTLDKNLEGFDHRLSLTPGELGEMILRAREVRSMFGDGTKRVFPSEEATRLKYQVSMVSSRPIKAGNVLTQEDVTYKNPGTGLTPSQSQHLFGKKAVCDVSPDTVILEKMFE